MLAGLMKGAGFVYASQTPESVEQWGALLGESMLDATRRMQPPRVAAIVLDAAETAMDTRELVRVEVPFRQMRGAVEFLADAGMLFSRWEWLPEPAVLPLDVRLGIIAEHLERVAWCLRTGRAVPPPPPGARPAHRADR